MGHGKLEAPPAILVFIALVAQAIKDKPEMFLGLRGRIALDVSDDRSITVRFGDARQPFEWGAREDADLRLTLSKSVLSRVLDGTIDAASELTSGGLLVKGNIRLLPPLVRLLERGRTMLALRCNR